MRIIYQVMGWPPERTPNGIVTYVGSVAAALRKAGHDPRIVAMIGDAAGDPHATIVRAGDDDYAKRTLAERIEFRLAPNREWFNLPARQIARTISADSDLRSADIIEAEESFGWANVLSRRLRRPVVIRLHGPHFLVGAAASDGPPSRFDRERVQREGAAIAAAPMVTAPSQFVVDAVERHYGQRLKRAVIIPNPTPAAEKPALWTPEGADPDMLLFVGRFDRIKGADILLEAYAALARERPRLKLTFVGPDESDISIDGAKYGRAAFVERFLPPDVAARVTFTGLLPPQAIDEYRKRAALTIVASRIEMFANVVIEAMATGSPLVATRVGGVPDIVRHEETGLLVAPEAGALSVAISRLLDDRAFAARIGAAARKDATARFTPDRVAAATIDAYRTFLDSVSDTQKGPN